MTEYAKLSRRDLVAKLEQLETEQRHAPVEQRIAAAALRDSEERIRGIVETAVEGIVTIDTRGIIASANPATEKLFGYAREELIGSSVNMLMPSPHRELHDGYIERYLRTGRARIIGIGREVVGQRKDGSIFPMDLSVGEFQLASGRMFAGIIRDISERKRLEKEVLEVSDREQQRIGQDLHDGLCQQLAGIELVCQTLEEDLLEAAPEKAGQAREIARWVREAITQARGLARGLSPVNLETEGLPFALGELAVATEKLFKVRCRVECDDTIEIREASVGTHLYRIAQEAIHNAVRHGKATEIVVRLRRDRRTMELRISDNGSGISPQPEKPRGMGLRIMKFRAGMIGGSLDIGRAGRRGTVVSCHFGIAK